MLFRPSESSKRITEFYRKYLLTTFATNNPVYNAQLKEHLEKPGTIADGPYISMADPYEKGLSLSDLAAEGIVSKEILKLKKFYPERKLYLHQERAIRKAAAGKNLVVTTGTGSGKTESFLIPVINQLMKEKEEGTLGPGVRTLIIYPMNALVNDQVRRLRELLRDMDGESKITFGRFTGETKESFQDAKRYYNEVEDIATQPLCENELISREQMRSTPPNILITNYAMLEYLLLRPGDNIIFSTENAKKWQYIVFDEAHSYNGAKAIEVSALIRRVKAMLMRDDIKFILTSDTLGDENANDKIINFAESLCDAPFDESSIIRSRTVAAKPVQETERLDFQMYRTLAEMIRDGRADSEQIDCIKSFGHPIESNEALDEMLYRIILHDEFYYDVRDVLFGNIITVREAARKLDISEEDFTDFIAVASNAMRSGERLFEAKYHMFLRGIEGVYVTLNPSNKLFINKMDRYRENFFSTADPGYKAYEISFCSNCNAIYIKGQVDEEGKLIQKSKQNDNYNPEIYLLSGELEEDDTDYDENVYQICAVCGEIKKAASVGGLQCGHGKENINKLIKVAEKGKALHKCACCHSVNGQRSIIRPYYLGNEAATAVISTALYSELPGEQKKINIKTYIDPLFGEEVETKEESVTPLSKQFLAFSDNRQSAAYFATYLDNTYKDTLIKRILCQIVEEKSEAMEAGISLKNFISTVADQFKRNHVFPDVDDDTVLKEAWKAVLKEMSNYKARNSLMRIAGAVFELDLAVPRAPIGIDLTAEECTMLFKQLSRDLMKDAAIEPGVNMTKADEEAFAVSGHIQGYLEKMTTNKYFLGWAPEEGRTNKRFKYIKKLLNGDAEKAKVLLTGSWGYYSRAGYLVPHKFYRDTAFLLNPDKIIVRRQKQLFMCNECKRVSPYSIKGICDRPGCSGELIAYDYTKDRENDHYYNVYHNLEIMPMSVHEHTAQLDSEQAYEYQKKFRDKDINVLSCSTTFEMGVDVGSLETVFMRNMPPSPANYAQRAGRAGRSLQSAAYAVTYCPNNSHDLNYFKNPTAMIKGSIVPPSFNVSNDKIVLRHIFASAFSFFWKTNEHLYKNTIGEFMECNGFEEFRKYLSQHPVSLKNYLKAVVPEELQTYFEIDAYGWIKELFSEEKDGFCDYAITRYDADLEDLRLALKRLAGSDTSQITESNAYEIARIQRSVNTIQNTKLIEFLSKNNLIPKYGFPVDTVELQGVGRKNSGLKLSLSRDLLSAISEYAPESEIVADGKLIKSRYVRRLSGHEWPKYNYMRCSNCETLNRSILVEDIQECRQCGSPLEGRKHSYIIPKFGFLMDNEEPGVVGMNKPERTYRGVISYIGNEQDIEFNEYEINAHRVVLGSSKMDTLAVLNEAPFYICETCGYGLLREIPMGKVIEKVHDNANGYRCSNSKLVNHALGHEFKTDVALIKFVDQDLRNIHEAWTILYSLIEGLSRSMNIDRNELSGCIQWYRDHEHLSGNFAFVLFDNTPGGAGYVRQLTDPAVLKNMLREGAKVVNNCTCGGSEADTACYSCLCNYYNQKQHDILKRKYAIDFFKSFGL